MDLGHKLIIWQDFGQKLHENLRNLIWKIGAGDASILGSPLLIYVSLQCVVNQDRSFISVTLTTLRAQSQLVILMKEWEVTNNFRAEKIIEKSINKRWKLGLAVR